LPPRRWQIAKAMQDSFAVRTFFLNYGFAFLRCALPHPPAEQPEQARSEGPHTAPRQGRHLVELRQGPVLGQKIAEVDARQHHKNQNYDYLNRFMNHFTQLQIILQDNR